MAPGTPGGAEHCAKSQGTLDGAGIRPEGAVSLPMVTLGTL